MYKKYLKRCFDVIFSIVLIVATLPLFLIISISLLLINKEVFFLQQRPGYMGKLFIVFKFKTMSNQVDSGGKVLSDELRVTKIGRFLRVTNLDELPQLFNILLGDMSFIGPRPFLEEYLSLYDEDQKRRHLVRPGLTGLAQINGGNMISWKEKLRFDLVYVENLNWILDLKILITTFFRVLTLKGFNTGRTIPEKFEGT